jgi:acetyl-CoA/propionyl-CoA carboxylase biotin carboxyl carrier protein
VVEQLRIADGHPLSFTEAPPPRGHSIEFRINAEDPGRGYLPTPGRITRFDAPGGPGVRVDTGVAAGSTVPGSFDSLMAKLVVTGATRQQALARARRALREFEIEGVASVLPFHRAVVEDAAFTGEQGFAVHTRWIETEMAARFDAAARPEAESAAPLLRTFVEIDGKRVRLGLPAGLALPQSAGASASTPAAAPASAPGDVPAPLTGSLVAWHRQTGDRVEAGEVIGVMEAMKMETALHAPQAGTLRCLAAAGEVLAAGQVVARVTP